MATMLLSAAGSAIGGSIGGSFLGMSAATIGGAIGSIAGAAANSMIVGALAPAQRIEGPRLDDLRVTSATEGAVIPQLSGTMRLGGNIIWATDFREEINRTSEGGSGKGGGPQIVTTEYLYFASFAVALCEGPIGGVCRIWADGKPMDVAGVVWRVHSGTEVQMPDPFIAAKEGPGQAPAYRGVAYVVFEDLLLSPYGNRIPQLSFEVIRPSTDPGSMERLIRAVNIIPGAGEFIYAATITRSGAAPGDWDSGEGDGTTVSENQNSIEGLADFTASMNRLDAALPDCGSVSLVVSWFGTDLRAGQCQIRPGVETSTKVTSPKSWAVNGVDRADAYVVSTHDGGPAYGGTPADFAVVQAIQDLQARGKRITFYPFVLMDVPEGNTLPDPYSDGAASVGQPTYPWRGRITCSPAAGYAGSVDKTGPAATQAADFFGSAEAGDFAVDGTEVTWTGSPGDFGFRRMILHYAHLCAAAGGVDAFLIGSELRGLTQIRSGAATYPAVAELIALSADVRAILGPDCKVSYAADWSEYFGHHPQDGSGDVFFHLDVLWADANVDFIGIDNYMPLSDWRDGDDHLDAAVGWQAITDLAYLRANIAGGEGFDWFYASPTDRDAQTRTPITDGAAGKPWVFRFKDLRSWWSNSHVNRPGGIESGAPTAWVPGAKPIRFTEAGVPCVDRGTNQPNVFVDPKSSESFLPYYPRGWSDETIQRKALEAFLGWWAEPANNPSATLYAGRMVDVAETAIWTWDARPFPAFPARDDVWADADNWRLGHWLNGRAGGSGLAELVRELCTRGGIDPALIETTQLAGSVPGFVVTALESPRASIETLMRLFGFDGVESGGLIRFVPRGGLPVATVTPDQFVAQNREAEEITFTRGQETELPLALKWRMMARDEDFAGITVEARRITVDTARIVSESLPIAATTGAAEKGVRRALFEEWVGREKAAFALPPSLVALDPTDVILIAHDARLLECALTGITDGEFRRCEARRADRAMYDLGPGTERTPSAPVPTTYGPPLALLMNLPQLSEESPDWQPYAAVHALPWYGKAALWRSAKLDGFQQITTISRPGYFGTLAFDFYAGPPGRFDMGNELWLDMMAGSLASVTDLQALGGVNTVAVETGADSWEVVGFATAVLQTPGRWKLTRLLRGLRGTDDSIANPVAAGARIVVLDASVKPVPITGSEYGAAWNWRIGPAGRTAADPANTGFAFTPTARGLRPWSPCHLIKTALAGGDLLLSWKRRTRAFAGDNWSLTEAPLGEASEAYDLQILNGSTVVRTVTGLSSSSFAYTAAMQAADFGGPVTTVRFRVFQIGALGHGAAAEALV